MPDRRAVFLDKDGTLVEDVPFNVDLERIRLTAGAAGALKCLKSEGFALVGISNQPGVARGLFHMPPLRVSPRPSNDSPVSHSMDSTGVRTTLKGQFLSSPCLLMPQT